MNSARRSVLPAVREVAEPVINELGFELVDIEYLASRGSWILRLYIDKDGGVTLDDCALVSREIGDLLDIRELIDHKYVLEISSPGLDRPLTKERDFTRALGKRIKVRTAEPVEGARKMQGVLKQFDGLTLTLELEKGVVNIPLQRVEKANLIYDFEKI